VGGIGRIANLRVTELVTIANYFTISTLFSLFTALLYFNYQRTIMHLSSDAARAYIDFLLSLLVGLFFGLSMLWPLSALFWLCLLTLIAAGRKAVLLHPNRLELAEAVGLVKAGTSSSRALRNRRDRRRARKTVAKAFQRSSDESCQTWGSYADPLVGFGAAAIVIVLGVILSLKATVQKREAMLSVPHSN